MVVHIIMKSRKSALKNVEFSSKIGRNIDIILPKKCQNISQFYHVVWYFVQNFMMENNTLKLYILTR